MNRTAGQVTRADSRGVRGTARYMARELARLFKSHDKGRKSDAVDACRAVDECQFRTLDSDELELAATAFVDALWAKDNIELRHMGDGRIDTAGIRSADYSQVTQELRKRAAIVGADPAYATTKAEAWRRHKSGGEYWTPFMKSQKYELRAALQDPAFPNKPRAGQSGPGPEPMRYVLAFELHDMHTERHWQQGIDVMVPYFSRILREHNSDSTETQL